MTNARTNPPLQTLLALVALTLVTSGCPGEEPGTDGTTTATTETSTNPGLTTSTTLPSDSTGPGATTSTDTGLDTSGTSSSGPADTSSSGSSGSSGSSDGSSGTTGDDTTTGGAELCEVMLPPPGMCGGPGNDPIGAQFECNPITQDDCPAGEKCMPWANDGGSSWNATRCAPLDPAPAAVGDPCMVEGSGVSGIDNCDIGTMCFGVDVMTNQGTCIELCGCSYDNPICDTPNTVCAITNGNSLPLCNAVCNPLDPAACPVDEGCYPVGDLFQCAPDASGADGAVGDPCQFINVCDPGTVCLSADIVPGCVGGVGCCSSTCDIDDPLATCQAGAECIAWYEGGAAPDACLGTVGVCAAI